PDNLPPEVRIRPPVSEADAEAIARSPKVRYAGVWVQVQSRMEYLSAGTQGLMIYGADNSFMEANGGALLRGRLFSQGALSSRRAVVVLEMDVADRLFGRIEPLGKAVRIGGPAFTVLGLSQKPANIF